MPNNTQVESTQERIENEAKDRRETVELALTDVSQACIDLFLVTVAGDVERRSATFWLEQGFLYHHKYQDRLRKYAAERKEAQARKENEILFQRYISMTPPKTNAELFTLMQRFGLVPQVQLPEAIDAKDSNAA